MRMVAPGQGVGSGTFAPMGPGWTWCWHTPVSVGAWSLPWVELGAVLQPGRLPPIRRQRVMTFPVCAMRPSRSGSMHLERVEHQAAEQLGVEVGGLGRHL